MNGTNATLNQLVKTFEQIAQKHAQINSFGYGEVWDITTHAVNNYPLLWVDIQPATMGPQTIQYNFRVYNMDLTDTSEHNQLEVKSDTIRVLWDVLFMLRDMYDLEITYGAATDFEEEFDDKVAGWYIDVGIITPQFFGTCDVPLKPCN